MALTQRGINIPVTGQFQDGDDIVNALIAQGLSVDSAIGSAIGAAVIEANNYTDSQVGVIEDLVGVLTAFNYRGDYVPGEDYATADTVAHDGSIWYAQSLLFDTTTRTNLVDDPRLVHTGDWTARSGSTLSQPSDGVIRFTTNADTGIANGNSALWGPYLSTQVTPGSTVAAGITVSVPTDGDTVQIRFGLAFDADGTPPPDSYPTVTLVTIEPGQTVTVTRDNITVPEGLPLARIEIRAGTVWPAGAVIDISKPIVEATSAVGAYFDGAMPDTVTVTHSWQGTPDNSPSVRIERVPVPTDLGEPGVDPHWRKIMPVSGGNTPSAQPIGAFTPDLVATTGSSTPWSMHPDRRTLYTATTLQVYQSRDEGETWAAIPGTFGTGQISGSPAVLENGQLLVLPYGSGEYDVGASVWVSSDYDPADPSGTTWDQTLAPRAARIRYTASWGVSIHGPMVLLNEYGPKQGQAGVAAGDHARYTYMSLDNGATWETILDLDDIATGNGMHLHGVAYDPWWDRIWVSYGDDKNGIVYSDDLGETWHTAYSWGSPVGKLQCVGIKPMPECILFGSDDTPNGVYRINRAEGKHTGTYDLDVAYAINASESRTHLCHAIGGLAGVLPGDAPVFFPFGMEDVAGYPCLVATRDGYNFETVWTSTHFTDAGRGLRAVVGPTAKGTLFVVANDGAAGGGDWSTYKGPAPY